MHETYAIGLDLGGTELKAALVRPDGAVEHRSKRDSCTSRSATAPFDAMEGAVRELMARAGPDVVGVGLGSPGVIHPERGRLVDRTAHLPHWYDQPLQADLGRRLRLPVVVDNDANLAALAEHRCGAARGARVSLTLTLGTGIGCGIVIDGRIFRGAWGGAGEIGHIALGGGLRPCPCGVTACVEPEASGSGLAEEARRLGIQPANATTVFARAGRGDVAARDLVTRFVDRLAAVIGTAVNLINPQVVVLGGGVAQAGEVLFGPLRSGIARYALASHRKGLRLEAAALGEWAGATGAGLLVWERE